VQNPPLPGNQDNEPLTVDHGFANLDEALNTASKGTNAMIDKLNSLKSIAIRQKMDWMECLTGCERNNIYYVYQFKDGKKGERKIMKYHEKSNYFQRQCLHGPCKPYKMRLSNIGGKDDKEENEEKQDVIRCAKDCQCTYLCINRGFMDSWYSDNNEPEPSTFLGRSRDPWTCLNVVFQIFVSQKEKVNYTLKASCLQCYFWVRCPCDQCQRVLFDIFDGEDESKPVGNITKIGRGCRKNIIQGNDADLFGVDFPANANWMQKAMLMNTVVFMDYTMFEDSSNNRRRNN